MFGQPDEVELARGEWQADFGVVGCEDLAEHGSLADCLSDDACATEMTWPPPEPVPQIPM